MEERSRVVTGEWIQIKGVDWAWQCSECGNWALMNSVNTGYRSNYCPHCGAKMESNEWEE